MNDSLQRLHARMACLGPLSRFRLALQLLAGERCVTELAAALGLSQSCTTRHLQAMAREGLVRGARAGKKVMFHLEPDTAGLLDLIAAARQSRVAPVQAGAPRGPRQRVSAKPAASAPREPRRARAERIRRVSPESGTPSAPAAAVRPARSNDLEDYLL